jgi:uncharacterized protein
MNDRVRDKENFLERIIKECSGALIAFSGGVDSTYLLSVAVGALGPANVLAVTIESPVVPPAEINEACKIARSLEVEHIVLKVDTIDTEEIRNNRPDRCYHCKKIIFEQMLAIAEERGLSCVFEASNCDDKSDYRPGLRAIGELGIRSPLIEADLTKEEIRVLSKERDLPTWNKPALACLATRIPYNEPLTKEKLEQVRIAEEYVCSAGFTSCRLRHHGSVARIEVPPSEIDRLLDGSTRHRIVERLRELGFTYIVVDLEGYRSGSMNETLDM